MLSRTVCLVESAVRTSQVAKTGYFPESVNQSCWPRLGFAQATEPSLSDPRALRTAKYQAGDALQCSSATERLVGRMMVCFVLNRRTDLELAAIRRWREKQLLAAQMQQSMEVVKLLEATVEAPEPRSRRQAIETVAMPNHVDDSAHNEPPGWHNLHGVARRRAGVYFNIHKLFQGEKKNRKTVEVYSVSTSPLCGLITRTKMRRDTQCKTPCSSVQCTISFGPPIFPALNMSQVNQAHRAALFIYVFPVFAFRSPQISSISIPGCIHRT